jgi:putative membrane protein
VYAQGTEPDPRFSMANERTALAWQRTGVSTLLVGGGAVLAAVHLGRPAVLVAALVALAGAAWTAVPPRGRPRPVPVLVARAAAATAALAVVGVLLTLR